MYHHGNIELRVMNPQIVPCQLNTMEKAKAKQPKKVEKDATKLAIIFTSGGGSSWAQGSDEDNHVLAYRAGKHFKLTWKHMFKFKKSGEQRLCVHLYDISNAEGWSADYAGNVTCLESKKECPYIEKIYVVV